MAQVPGEELSFFRIHCDSRLVFAANLALLFQPLVIICFGFDLHDAGKRRGGARRGGRGRARMSEAGCIALAEGEISGGQLTLSP